MLISLAISLGALGAAATIVIALKLVPAVRDPMSLPEAQLVLREAMRRAERDVSDEVTFLAESERKTREELRSLRRVMLQQRLEIAQLRSQARQQWVEFDVSFDPRAQELESRSRRARAEARQFSELPVGSAEVVPPLLEAGEQTPA